MFTPEAEKVQGKPEGYTNVVELLRAPIMKMY